jgi:putative glutamine amidotransferase
LAQQYALAHPVRLAPGTAMAAWAGGETAMVNSLHGQGVDRLAEGLAVLARADDGLVEAFEVSDAPAFAVAVQWHPEWQALEYPFYAALFRAFGQACAARRAARLGH